MAPAQHAPPAKYDVEVHNVREVTLLGTADLPYWSARLRDTGLYPTDVNGRAQIMFCAAAMRFMGIGARELSVSIAVSERPEASRHDGYYLVHAFNSVRLFAWFERTWFHTPYQHAAIHVDPQTPASMQAKWAGTDMLHAFMETGARAPATQGAGWEGPVYLPNGRVFFARLAGDTQTYPFSPGDRLLVNPVLNIPVLQWLVDSGVVGQEWIVRPNATHGKSRTRRRGS